MAAEPFPERPLPNCYWVYPGEFLAGEHPRKGTRSSAELRERLRALMDAGIDSFLDLTMPEEFDPYDLDLPPGVRYVRRPIRDHSLPSKRDHMVDILRHLDRELRSGRRVYVHCHAGIGRTGMVAGCMLVERGSPGPAALEELNQLWQHCDRSHTWDYVPETDEQVEFVRTWQAATLADPVAQLAAIPLRSQRTKSGAAAKADRKSSSPEGPAPVRPATAKTAVAAGPAGNAPAGPALAPGHGLQDRFVGALLGLAVADALANGTQGLKPGSFAPVTGFRGGGALELPPGAWSDDTATALCIAESLLECDGSDPRDQVQRFTDWQQEGYLSATDDCVGITANTAKALAGAQWRRQVYPGSHDPRHLDPELLSRIAPTVMFGFGSVEDAAHLACEAARITCQAPGALDTCRLFAAYLHAALSGEPRSRVVDPDVELADATRVREKVEDLLAKARGRTPRTGPGIAEALAAALWAFEAAESFADGALRVANLGGGCDAVAAAYGQLAGAHFGAQAIPAAWRSGLVRRELIEGFAGRLLAHAQRR